MELNGTLAQVGGALAAGALPALPALCWAEALVDYIGHSNVFISAFTFYCLRYIGVYSVVKQYPLERRLINNESSFTQALHMNKIQSLLKKTSRFKNAAV